RALSGSRCPAPPADRAGSPAAAAPASPRAAPAPGPAPPSPRPAKPPAGPPGPEHKQRCAAPPRAPPQSAPPPSPGPSEHTSHTLTELESPIGCAFTLSSSILKFYKEPNSQTHTTKDPDPAYSVPSKSKICSI